LTPSDAWLFNIRMEPGLKITFPLTDSVQVFFLVLLIVFITPIIFRRLRIPGIVGLILCGMLVGPYGLNLLSGSTNFSIFSTIGVIYLMFLAGLELDLQGFLKHRYHSIVFGAATFLIPLASGYFICRYALGYPFYSALLLASMFSTHTLLAYPISSRLGINKTLAVTITIGGTIITDTAVLLLLAFISNLSQNQSNYDLWLMSVLLLLLILLILFGLPRITRWFFKNYKGEGSAQYLFVLTMVFLSAFLSEMIGIEPIIGAFIAGLALNRSIPESSVLMNRITFIGNTLFIPFFLVSVGMIVDLGVLFKGPYALYLSGILIVVALITKYLAAWVTQKIFRLTSTERNVIFGLSSAHAAAILAVILVGFRIGLVDENVLNGTVLLILVTCLVSSFVTEIYGRKLAVSKENVLAEHTIREEKILVPVSNPENIENMFDFALALKDHRSFEPLYPLTVVADNPQSESNISTNLSLIEKTIVQSGKSRDLFSPVSRVDVNAVNGIVRAIREMMISKIVIGWREKQSTLDYFFGDTPNSLLVRTDQMIVLVYLNNPLNTIGNIVAVLPPFSEFEYGFEECVKALSALANNCKRSISYIGKRNSIAKLQQVLKFSRKQDYEVEILTRYPEMSELAPYIGNGDLLIMVSARPRTLSYLGSFENLPRKISREFHGRNFAVIYPAQRQIDPNNLSAQLEGMDLSPIQENIDRIRLVRNKIIKLFKKR
jgi:Kef-type K+ transport system membrane component KefB